MGVVTDAESRGVNGTFTPRWKGKVAPSACHGEMRIENQETTWSWAKCHAEIRPPSCYMQRAHRFHFDKAVPILNLLLFSRLKDESLWTYLDDAA